MSGRLSIDVGDYKKLADRLSGTDTEQAINKKINSLHKAIAELNEEKYKNEAIEYLALYADDENVNELRKQLFTVILLNYREIIDEYVKIRKGHNESEPNYVSFNSANGLHVGRIASTSFPSTLLHTTTSHDTHVPNPNEMVGAFPAIKEKLRESGLRIKAVLKEILKK